MSFRGGRVVGYILVRENNFDALRGYDESSRKSWEEGMVDDMTGHGRRRLWRQQFTHDGVRFVERYEPHGIGIGIAGSIVSIPASSSAAEQALNELARLIASRDSRVDDAVFRRNFLSDLRRLLPRSLARRLRTWDDLDVSRLVVGRTSRSATRPSLSSSSSWAVLDGSSVQLSRVMVDRPGIFLGRSTVSPHDGRRLLGRVRRRIEPRDVEINISRDGRVPVPRSIDGLVIGGPDDWGGVLHDPSVTWAARWRDELTGTWKYVYLDTASTSRQTADRDKFEKARRFRRKSVSIWARVRSDLSQRRDSCRRQLAACAWLIETFAIRRGSSLADDDDDEDGGGGVDERVARAIGATTLRVRNVHFTTSDASSSAPDVRVRLAFVGKHGIPYCATSSASLDPLLLRVLRERCDSPASSLLFPCVTSHGLQCYLASLMPGLTAKVIRTYRASHVADVRLRSIARVFERDASRFGCRRAASAARAALGAVMSEVALLCNHRSRRRDSVSSSLHAAARGVCDIEDETSSRRLTRTVRLMLLSSSWSVLHRRANEVLSIARVLRLSASTARVNYVDPRIVLSYCIRAGIAFSSVYSPRELRRFEWASREVSTTSATRHFVF